MKMDIRKLTRTSLLLALAIVFQTIGRAYPILSQFFVGPMVNTIFIVCLIMNGLGWSVLVAMLTPVLAWSLGQLPQPLGPIIPVIALGNITFIIVFHFGRKLIKREMLLTDLISVICAAFLKFCVIFFGVKALLQLLSLAQQAEKAATKLMGINQFITALAGGIIALAIVKLMENRLKGQMNTSQ
ncbi:ECF transporter S component [Clostridium thermarum]|uniref:ECF transporter S component n=1 Tax=Clostridium thermarum TaxID=1716543 RepID=UPI001124C552|nr:ECF transporter S component [Clostridium thermarum]